MSARLVSKIFHKTQGIAKVAIRKRHHHDVYYALHTTVTDAAMPRVITCDVCNHSYWCCPTMAAFFTRATVVYLLVCYCVHTARLLCRLHHTENENWQRYGICGCLG